MIIHVIVNYGLIKKNWSSFRGALYTELRNIRGRYYLYGVTSKWDPSKGRAKKITLGMLGTITKEGFIPKGQSKKGRPVKGSLKVVTTKEYGATKFLEDISKDILAELKACYLDDWQSIFVLAVNRLLYQAPLKNCGFLFEESFLSESFKAEISKDQLTKLLQVIGSNRDNITKFLRRFISGSKNIVFDATHLVSESKAKMAQKGYNSNHDYEPQINLLYMFDTDNKEPNYYRIFPGNIHGTSALKICLKEANLKNCLVIGDKGFCSEKNLSLIQELNLNYILPLRRDNKLIDYTRLESKFYQKAFDGHFMYQDRAIFYTSLEKQNGNKIIIFTDKTLLLEEEQCYLRRIEANYEGYNIKRYQEKQIQFGTISMITNCLESSPQKIYESYKTRMEVEIVFDTYKNLLYADRTYMHSDSSMESWVFINHIATMLYYRIFNLLKAHDLLKSLSPMDLLMRLSKINKIKINDQWVTSEVNSNTRKIMQKLEIDIT